MARQEFLSPEQICWQALHGEMGLAEAARRITDQYTECALSDVYPDAAVIEEMLGAIRQDPNNQQAIENGFREAALLSLEKLLDEFTTPDMPYEERTYPIPRAIPTFPKNGEHSSP